MNVAVLARADRMDAKYLGWPIQIRDAGVMRHSWREPINRFSFQAVAVCMVVYVLLIISGLKVDSTARTRHGIEVTNSC